MAEAGSARARWHPYGTPLPGCAQGPNIVGGYTHPTTGKIVTREEHKAAQGAAEAEWHATHAGAE